MDPEEAYQAVMKLILADEPSNPDGMAWDRIALSFTVSPPNQNHINHLVEAASHQLLGQLTDTLCRMLMHDPNNLAALTTGLFQDCAAAIAGLPQRVVGLRALRGAEFCEGVRRVAEERWVVRDVVPTWEVIGERRDAELDGERRRLMERAGLGREDSAREM